MITNIRYVLLTALRDRIFLGMLIVLIVSSLIASLLGSTAFTEKEQMTIVYAASAMRVILMLGVIVFACFHVRNAFESKEIDVMLSRPVSRTSLVLSYWAGFFVVGLFLMVPVLAMMAFFGPSAVHGFAAWAVSLACELMLVTAMSLFAAFMMRSAVMAVMASLGFYALSRMMAFFVMTANSSLFEPGDFDLLRQILNVIAMLLPRFDLFAQSEWLIYGLRSSKDWLLFGMQSTIYLPLLLVMSVLDFRRKEF